MRESPVRHMSGGAEGAARRLWSHTPVGSSRSNHQPGDAQYFADLRAYRYGYETPFIPRFFDFPRMMDRTVLEFGVGYGIDAVEMARHGAIYTGIDITVRHIELTRQNFAVSGLAPSRILCGDLLQTDVGGPFDFIYSFGVLHHVGPEADYLSRARRLLAPGGRLLIGLYSKYSFFNAYLLATWGLRAGRGVTLDDWRSHCAELSPLRDPVTIRIRSRREVQSLLRDCGFAVKRYGKRGFVQAYIPVLGRWLSPDGVTLNACGAALGWYHLFECSAAQAPDGGTER